MLVLLTTAAIAQSRPQPASNPTTQAPGPAPSRPLPLQPYTIQIRLSVSESASLTPRLREQFVRRLLRMVSRTVGSLWECTVVDGGVRRSPLDHESDLAWEDAAGRTSNTPQPDKVFLVHLQENAGHDELCGRELTVATQHWGPTLRMRVFSRDLLDRETVTLCWRIFTPTAVPLPDQDREQLDLELKGGALPPRDASLPWVQPGDVFSLVRTFRSEGEVRVEPVLWTYLKVQSIREGIVSCQALSAYRDPASRRAPGSQLIAQAVRTSKTPTRIRFLDLEGEHSLAGYEVRVAESIRQGEPFTAATDANGWVEIPPERFPGVVSVQLRSGSRSLASVWVVPGSVGAQEIRVPDPQAQLTLERRLTALREALVDEIARRVLTIRRVQSLMDRQDWSQAEQAFSQYNTSPSFFEDRLRQIRAELQRTSPEMREARFEQMLAETEAMIKRYLDPQSLVDLHAELRTRKAQAAPAANP